MDNKEKKVYECTIDPQLLESWKRHVRHGDALKIMKEAKLSRPVVDRALNFGYVLSTGIAEKITKYFVKRAEGEKKAAEQLNNLL